MAKSKVPDKCAACKYKGTPLNPLEEAKDGKLVHKHHFVDPNSGYYRQKK